MAEAREENRQKRHSGEWRSQGVPAKEGEGVWGVFVLGGCMSELKLRPPKE